MAYVEPTQVVTGAPITAAKWNQDVVNNTLALYNTPGVLYEYVTTISNPIASQAENTLIPFTDYMSETYSNSVTVDNTVYKLTADVAGVYAVFMTVITESTTSANNGSLFAQSNDGQFIASRTFQHPAIGGGLQNFMSIMGFKNMAAGEYVQFYFRQNLLASLRYIPSRIGMHWIGSGV